MRTAPIELGILLHTAHHIRDDNARSDLSPVIDGAKQAEELGFASVWVGDSSRMERGWPRADCLSMLTAFAMATERIGLGIVPLSTPLRNPVLLAHQLATIDVLSHGRLLVAPSIGKGGPEGTREFLNVGVPYNERGARLTEMLQIMTRLWTEPSVTFPGRFYQLEDAALFPKPINRPIPLLVATGGAEPALRRAGRYGTGWFTADTDPEHFAREHQAVLEAARSAGRDPKEVSRVGLYTTAHLERDADRAAPEAERHMRAYFGTHTNNTSDLIGSPEQIARRLQPLVDEGLTLLVPRFVDPDLPRQTELLREALSLLHPSVQTPSA